MCSRYTIIGTKILAERFSVPEPAPRYNAAPGQLLPIITTDRELHTAIFGVPRHDGSRQINIQMEGLEGTKHLRGERSAIPASGFYEWKQEGVRKQPYYFFFPDSLIVSFAGIYFNDTNAFSIITTDATDPVFQIHSRMPYILSPSGEKAWISGMNPLPTVEKMEVVAVSRRINNPAAPDEPSLIRPAEESHSWW